MNSWIWHCLWHHWKLCRSATLGKVVGCKRTYEIWVQWIVTKLRRHISWLARIHVSSRIRFKLTRILSLTKQRSYTLVHNRINWFPIYWWVTYSSMVYKDFSPRKLVIHVIRDQASRVKLETMQHKIKVPAWRTPVPPRGRPVIIASISRVPNCKQRKSERGNNCTKPTATQRKLKFHTSYLITYHDQSFHHIDKA